MNRFKTLKDHVYDYIAEQILIGTLHPEERINESSICEELSISRTPVREALIQLSSEGILENVPRKGFVVKSLSKKEAEELYVIIGKLDGLAVKLAYPYLTEKDFQHMQFYIDSMNLALDSQNYEMYLNQQKCFHQLYIDKCKNDALIDQIEKLKNKLLRQNYLNDDTAETYETLVITNQQHQKILDYLRSGDISSAEKYLADVHWSTENAHFEATDK